MTRFQVLRDHPFVTDSPRRSMPGEAQNVYPPSSDGRVKRTQMVGDAAPPPRHPSPRQRTAGASYSLLVRLWLRWAL